MSVEHSQVSALRALINKATPDALRRGGIVYRISEGEMLVTQLAALLRALEADQQ